MFLYDLHKAVLSLSQKVIHLKIIWFYLVRAEVVLWWHCLIFIWLFEELVIGLFDGWLAQARSLQITKSTNNQINK